MLLRNHEEPPQETLRALRASIDQAESATSLPQLLGIEGNGARLYFSELAGMLKVTETGSFRIDRSPVADRWAARLAAMGPIPPIIGAVLLLVLLGSINPVLVWLAVMLGLVGGVLRRRRR